MKKCQWVVILIVAALISGGCKQSNPKNVVENTAGFSQIKFAEVKNAADKGNAAAQYEIGVRFHDGKDVLKDSTEAAEWWQKSVAQKFPPAEVNLGMAYGKGDGVLKNEQEGVRLIRAAADSGYARAQQMMGIFCFLGSTNVPKDYKQTFRWVQTAANQGYPPSQYFLALCYRDGKGTETNLSASILWLQRAASNEVVNAQVTLAECYGEGLGVKKNPQEAFSWYRKAAYQGDRFAAQQTSVFYALAPVTTNRDDDLIESYKWMVLTKLQIASNIINQSGVTFSSSQIAEGKRRAIEFSKTNHVTSISLPELPGL